MYSLRTQRPVGIGWELFAVVSLPSANCERVAQELPHAAQPRGPSSSTTYFLLFLLFPSLLGMPDVPPFLLFLLAELAYLSTYTPYPVRYCTLRPSSTRQITRPYAYVLDIRQALETKHKQKILSKFIVK